MSRQIGRSAVGPSPYESKSEQVFVMLNRRVFAIALCSALASVPAMAFEKKAFETKAFQAAQDAGRPILIEVSAPWCPTCKAQKPILARLAAKPKFKDFAVFEVDFDSQKEVLRMLNVRQQSTLLLFKEAKEVGRSTGDTDPASIEDLLNKAI